MTLKEFGQKMKEKRTSEKLGSIKMLSQKYGIPSNRIEHFESTGQISPESKISIFAEMYKEDLKKFAEQYLSALFNEEVDLSRVKKETIEKNFIQVKSRIKRKTKKKHNKIIRRRKKKEEIDKLETDDSLVDPSQVKKIILKALDTMSDLIQKLKDKI